MALAASFDVSAVLVLGAPVLVAAAAGLAGGTRRGPAFDAADRNVSAFSSGMGISGAFLSAAPFAGLSAALYVLGSDGLAWLVGCAAGLVLMGVMIAPYFRAAGAVTVADFMARRFRGPGARVTSALIAVACGLPLLVMQFAVIGSLGEWVAHVPYWAAVAAAAVAVVVTLAPGGMRGATWAGAALLTIVLIACLVPLAKLAVAKSGIPFGHIAYGPALQEVQRLETTMIVNGLADARSLKPHVRPFLQIDFANTLALIVSLIAGTAALPHVLMRNAATASVRETRMAMAWGLLLVAIVLSAVPAYAGLVKQELYGFIAKGAPLAELDARFQEYSRNDLVRVHGVSLKLLSDVIDGGGGDAAAVSQRLEAPASRAAWADLKPQVKTALIEAAKAAPGADYDQRWEALRSKVFPVAAMAAGNKTGKLTQGGLTIAPDAIVPFGLSLAGVSGPWLALFAAGAVAAGLATAAAVSLSVGQALGRDLGGVSADSSGVLTRQRVAIIGTVAAGALFSLLRPTDVMALASWTFSLAAAALFPALVLSIWWRRTTAAGAIAGMIAGFVVAALYIAGTAYQPVRFFEASAPLSNAAPSAAKRLTDLKDAAAKADGSGKATADAALELHARGSSVTPGVANWFGVHSRAAGLFGLPVGFLTIVLVSLVTRRPSAEALRFADGLRRPGIPQAAE